MKHIKLTDLKTHAFWWLLYSIICHLINLLSYPEASYMMLLAILPLTMAVFYFGRSCTKWFHNNNRGWLVLLAVPLTAVPIIALCYLVVYILLPAIGLSIPYTLDVTWQELVHNLLPTYMRFMAYGATSYYMGQSKLYNRLQAKRLAVQLVPHSMYNMCIKIAETLTYDRQKANRYLRGYMGIIHYAARVPDLSEDLVPLDLELLKLKKFLDTCQDEITIEQTGDFSHHVVPPFAIITLIENALKHRLPDTAVHLCIRCEDHRLAIRCANTPNPDESPAAGLGLGLRNLEKRIDLLRADGQTASLFTGLQEGSYIALLELTNKNS